MTDLTFCSQCQHSIQEGPLYRWQCQRHQRREGMGFVSPDHWVKDPPFLFCRDVNGGACPLFERMPENDAS